MRICKFDNLKFLGIFLIVFGHMLGAVNCGKVGDCLYMIIYSFHVPLFIFIMGYFAKYKKWEWLKVLILYLVFQTIYLTAFNIKHLMTGEYFLHDYTIPFWLAWFLMVMLIYRLITPLVLKLTVNLRFILLGCSIIFAIFASYVPHLGIRFSSMRAVSFLPFFIFGTIWKEIGLKPTKKYLWLCLTIICIIFISVQDLFDENVLYGVTGDPMQRIIFYSVAFTWIIFLMVWMPNREISKTVSRIGQNTLPVFLFHGLIIKTVFTFINPEFGLFNMVICIVSSLLLCVVLAQEKLTNLLLLKRK